MNNIAAVGPGGDPSVGETITDLVFDSNVHLNVTSAPEDAEDLIYTPVDINGIKGRALVDSGATTMFVSKTFLSTHEIPVSAVSGSIKDGRGQVMARRAGCADITVVNGKLTVRCKADVVDMRTAETWSSA